MLLTTPDNVNVSLPVTLIYVPALIVIGADQVAFTAASQVRLVVESRPVQDQRLGRKGVLAGGELKGRTRIDHRAVVVLPNAVVEPIASVPALIVVIPA